MSYELERMKFHYHNRSAAAKEWKARGGQVVGYVCNSVTEEMIIAAGFLPVRLTGTPGGKTEDIVKYFGVAKYTEGFINTMLNDLVTGEYEYLDYLILPHTRNTVETQYSHLCMVRDIFPDVKLPELYKIEEFQSWSHNSVEYHIDRLKEFKTQLEQWSGRVLSDRVLYDAIDICNENRRLLGQVQQLRAQALISGAEALEIIGSSFFMEKQEHNRLLDIFLRSASKRAPLSGKRLFVESSPQDNLQFYELVEDCGAIIINEDHCWGSRSIEGMVDTERFQDPIEAIAQRYHYKSPCSYIFFPARARCGYCKEKMSETRADGVIFHVLENDAGQLWDYPDQLKAAEEMGLKTLSLLHQPYLLSDEIKDQVSAFVSSL